MTSYAQHYRSTLKLGVPLCIGQIGVILVGFADTLMVGITAQTTLRLCRLSTICSTL